MKGDFLSKNSFFVDVIFLLKITIPLLRREDPKTFILKLSVVLGLWLGQHLIN